ncbi:hypothetical protein BC826DRAFT_1105349 [Russula brevipes]|nr:hypothetical protein BC826DRAFT_1105349 [Russula brevipes]
MASTSTHARPPPLTTNKLDAVQRARVMRSSRKLGAVLGTTPFLLESCGVTVPATLHSASRSDDAHHARAVPSHVKRHHRQCSILGEPRASSESLPLPSLSRSSSSSKESLLSTSDCSTEESVVPLMLAANSPFVRESQRLILVHSVPLPPPSDPHPPNADVPPTPTTPIEPNCAEARRRKMARVMRTLGEKVPPELVFRTDNSAAAAALSRTRSAPTSHQHQHRRRSASVDSTSQWQRLLELPAPIFSSSSKAPDDQGWVGEWNRRNIGQVQRELRGLRRR